MEAKYSIRSEMLRILFRFMAHFSNKSMKKMLSVPLFPFLLVHLLVYLFTFIHLFTYFYFIIFIHFIIIFHLSFSCTTEITCYLGQPTVRVSTRLHYKLEDKFWCNSTNKQTNKQTDQVTEEMP